MTKRRKRPHMSLSVKLEAAILQLGLDPNDVEYDHDPALALRRYDEKTGKWTPDANDPRYITLRSGENHNTKTNGTKTTSYGSDSHAIAKAKRIRGETKTRPKKKIKSRGFQPPPPDYDPWSRRRKM